MLEKLANDARFLVLSPKGKPRAIYAQQGSQPVQVLTNSEDNPKEYSATVPRYFRVVVNEGEIFGEPSPFGSNLYNRLARWYGTERAVKTIFPKVETPLLVGPSTRRYEHLSPSAKPTAEQVVSPTQ